MDRRDNKYIFEDTMRRIKENRILAACVSDSIKDEELILEKDEYIPSFNITYPEEVKIVVSRKRTFEAAVAYKGMKTAVLNFASAVSPGGGVTGGSFAQEESLCRCSTLYPCLNTEYLWANYYEPHRNGFDRRNTDDTIYTPHVIVFKQDELYPVALDEQYWFPVNIVTTAAPDLKRPRYQGEMGCVNLSDDELMALHLKRAERILSIAAGEGNEVVILGAFGCGAFHNPPRIVAEAFKNVIKESFLHKFKVIEFAIYTNPFREESENAAVFSEVFDFEIPAHRFKNNLFEN